MLRFVLTGLFLTCLLSFSWARRSFFAQDGQASRVRRGLGPLGSAFGIALIWSLLATEVLPPHHVLVAAAAFGLASLALFWASVRSFRDEKPAIAFSGRVPNEIVTSGPYGLMRHPLYVAYMLCWIGGAVAVPNAFTLGAPLVLGAYYVMAARGEERAISRSKLGTAYAKYSSNTGMFFPIPRCIRRVPNRLNDREF